MVVVSKPSLFWCYCRIATGPYRQPYLCCCCCGCYRLWSRLLPQICICHFMVVGQFKICIFCLSFYICFFVVFARTRYEFCFILFCCIFFIDINKYYLLLMPSIICRIRSVYIIDIVINLMAGDIRMSLPQISCSKIDSQTILHSINLSIQRFFLIITADSISLLLLCKSKL